jgi:hypothetical protein
MLLLLPVALCVSGTPSAAASTWVTGLNAGSSASASAQPLPAAPTASAACSGLILGSIVVTWTSVPHATSYAVSESTTSATSGFSIIASGLSGSPHTVSGLLGHYWFEVDASIGPNWIGPPSAATSETSITLVLCSEP